MLPAPILTVFRWGAIDEARNRVSGYNLDGKGIASLRNPVSEGLLPFAVLGKVDDRAQVLQELQTQIHALPRTQLEELGETLLDFDGLADLVNWLQTDEASRGDYHR